MSPTKKDVNLLHLTINTICATLHAELHLSPFLDTDTVNKNVRRILMNCLTNILWWSWSCLWLRSSVTLIMLCTMIWTDPDHVTKIQWWSWSCHKDPVVILIMSLRFSGVILIISLRSSGDPDHDTKILWWSWSVHYELVVILIISLRSSGDPDHVTNILWCFWSCHYGQWWSWSCH